MPPASFGAIPNKIFIGTWPNTKSIDLAILIVFSNNVYYCFCIENCTISQKVKTAR